KFFGSDNASLEVGAREQFAGFGGANISWGDKRTSRQVVRSGAVRGVDQQDREHREHVAPVLWQVWVVGPSENLLGWTKAKPSLRQLRVPDGLSSLEPATAVGSKPTKAKQLESGQLPAEAVPWALDFREASDE